MMLDCDIESSELSSEEFDNLTDIATALSEVTQGDGIALNAYKEQLQFICMLLKPYGHSVLQGLSLILIEGLNKLVDEKRQLTADECLFLKKIPKILSEYAYIPTSKIPDAHLLTHCKNPLWIRPINSQEEKEFIQLLIEANDEPVENNQQSAENSVDKLVVFSAPEAEVEVAEESEINLSDLLTLEKFSNLESSVGPEKEDVDELAFENLGNKLTASKAGTVLPDEYDGQNTDGEPDVLDLSSFASKQEVFQDHDLVGTGNSQESLESGTSAICKENELDEQALNLTDFVRSLDESEGDELNEPAFDSDIDLQDMLVKQKATGCIVESQEIKDVDLETPLALTKPSSNFSISEEQQELVKLIGDELEDIIADKELTNISLSEDIEAQKEHLITVAEQAENISNAVDLIGLEGLGNACRYISGNIHSLALEVTNLTKPHARLIKNWPGVILSYLKNIATEKSSEELIHYIKDELWPNPISEKAVVSLTSLLIMPEMEEEEKERRQSVANADDMSLELPGDVNPELLEGLLQDLPVQSAEFSAAIQNLQDQKDLEYLEVAQRIAHTLKGAGNVVGVRGIANLTHHLEDILEIQSKANNIPSTQLLDVLVDASDCLETISEALLGIDDPPDNSLLIYQSVLDWANKLDLEGATEFSEDDLPGEDSLIQAQQDQGLHLVESDKKNTALDKENKSEVKKPINIENMLRVPAKLADDLLRIAGENLISTSQIQEYIKIIQSRYKSLKVHDQVLQKLSFELEHIVDVQGIANSSSENNTEDGFDPLELDQYHELHSMSRRLIEIAADSIELTQVLENDFAELQNLVITQDRLQKENEALVLRTRMVPTSTIIPRLKRGVKQACRLTGKQVELEVVDSDTYMDSEVLNGLIEPLMHILRNSVDHGIESSDERVQSNKEIKGHIKLVFVRRGDQIIIDVQDDGKGLDLEKIREKAVASGLAEHESDVMPGNLQKYILQPGFSTRIEVSHVSGRGIGLDVVNSKIRELKGSIQVSSDEGIGCLFSLTLPISSFSVHSLLVRVRENIYALSNRGVEEILYPGLGELQEVGHEAMFKLDDQFYNIAMVETLLSLPEDRRDVERSSRPVILVKDDNGNHTAILVEDVLDSRDVVVKSMGPYIPRVPGVVGATVLGDGSIAPVIDLPELMQSVKSMEGQLRYSDMELETGVTTSTKLPYVLVVDDSLSARKSLAQFVQDLGLEVRTARDGMEAVSLIDVRKPDLILVDMEMPRMNGLELTSHIRASSNTQDMPVIMITSRSTDKHRSAAIDKGVDHYMVKPFAEDELALHINKALKIA